MDNLLVALNVFKVNNTDNTTLTIMDIYSKTFPAYM